MAARRKQKIVLRAKVRQERLGRWAALFFRVAKGAALLGLAGLAVTEGRRFLFHSDTFMIKSVHVEPADGPFAGPLRQAMAAAKGRSIFKISSERMEKDARERFPALRSASVSRSFPDGLRVRYDLRRPLAWVRTSAQPASRWLVDGEGACFPPAPSVRPDPALIELSAASTASLSSPIAFLKDWSKTFDAASLNLSTAGLRGVAVDSIGEISTMMGPAPTRVVWGRYDAATFPEKYRRLRDVWADLDRKGQRAQYINLREVPQKNPSVLGDTEVVGRVFVRTLAEKPK